MQRLEVSGAVRPIYGSLGVKRLILKVMQLKGIWRSLCIVAVHVAVNMPVWRLYVGTGINLT